MKNLILASLVLLSGIVASSNALAQVPQYISYQGLAVDRTSGQPIADGNHSVSVSFFASADSTAQSLANFTIPNVVTSKGTFNVMIQVTDKTVFARPVFMGVKIDNSGFIGQPTAVSAAPYAFYSMEATHAKVADSSGVAFRAVHATVADSVKGGVNVASRQSIGAAASGANSDITSLTGLLTPLPIAEGGTSASSASAARTNLGAAASGTNGDITALTALSTPLTIAQGGTGATSASAARTNISAAASGANGDITALSALSTPLTVGQGGTGGNTASAARTALGLGSIATQASNAATITGGTIDGTPVGSVSPASGAFTTLQNTGNVLTLGSENDLGSPVNTVNITGTVPIAVVLTGAATGPITANVAAGVAGQWLYIVNRSNFTVSFAGTIINANAAAQFLNVTGLWFMVL